MSQLDVLNARFQAAEELYRAARYDAAAGEYMGILESGGSKQFEGFCQFRLAQIANNAMQDPETAYSLFYDALGSLPNIAENLLGENNPNRTYVFRGMNGEQELEACPLCGGQGEAHWCYPLFLAAGYNTQFNPIRLWMRCDACNHLYTRYYPEKLFLLNDNPRQANPAFFAMYADMLSRLRAYTKGNNLFEVGIGAGECLLVAEEMGFQAYGIDVIARHVRDAQEKYGLAAEACDFLEYRPTESWDMLVMGDVLEHVSDPVLAMQKAYDMLNEDGALWISTPNFESAFSKVAAHNDPMRMQTYHLNYFSRQSLYQLLEEKGFTPVDYRVSAHYNGSMEVIAVKHI